MRTQAVRAAADLPGIWPPVVLRRSRFLALWQWFVEARDIKPFVLPKPTAICRAAAPAATTRILEAARVTGANALVGLVGRRRGRRRRGPRWPAACACSTRCSTPLAAAMAAMPIVALAPIFNTMFASTSSTAAAARGRRSSCSSRSSSTRCAGCARSTRCTRELMRSYAASAVDDHAQSCGCPARCRSSSPGCGSRRSLAVIAAIVAEYFGGLQNGLGPAITSAAAASAYPRAWAYRAGAIVLGLVFLPRRACSPSGLGDALACTATDHSPTNHRDAQRGDCTMSSRGGGAARPSLAASRRWRSAACGGRRATTAAAPSTDAGEPARRR